MLLLLLLLFVVSMSDFCKYPDRVKGLILRSSGFGLDFHVFATYVLLYTAPFCFSREKKMRPRFFT